MENKKERLVKSSTPVAAKEHTCCKCGKAIPKGEKYLCEVYSVGGKMERRYQHLKCEKPKMVAFEKGAVRGLQPMTDREYREYIHDETERILESFSYDESIRIALVPLIITEMAWIFADKVLDYCAEHKVSQTVKLSRAVRRNREDYINELRKDLSQFMIDEIFTQSRQFVTECSQTLLLLYFQIDNCIKNQWKNISDVPMVIYTQIGLLLLDLLEKNEKNIAKIIKERTGHYSHVASQNTVVLKQSLEAYNKYEVRYSEHVTNCMNVIENKLNRIEFTVHE